MPSSVITYHANRWRSGNLETRAVRAIRLGLSPLAVYGGVCAAFWLLAHGYFILGGGIFLLAKVVGVAIAAFLFRICEPKLMLIDEPSLGLAPAMVDQVFEALEAVHRSGVSMLLIEQNVTRALEIAGRAYVLEGGRTVADGPAHELREQAHIRQAYLGEAA